MTLVKFGEQLAPAASMLP